MVSENRQDRSIILLLRFVGIVTLLAFGAAVMPAKWIVEASEWLGFEPFPDSPLTFYLARNLSLLYGYIGALLLLISFDLPRYRPMIRYIALGTVSFGFLQLIVDSMSELPWWWTLGEGVSTIFGGGLVYLVGVRGIGAKH
ncbi:MAG: hypothetical protein AAGG48_13970 [Planctomycetota bacterium]